MPLWLCTRTLYLASMATSPTKARLTSAIVMFYSVISPSTRRTFSAWNRGVWNVKNDLVEAGGVAAVVADAAATMVLRMPNLPQANKLSLQLRKK